MDMQSLLHDVVAYGLALEVASASLGVMLLALLQRLKKVADTPNIVQDVKNLL